MSYVFDWQEVTDEPDDDRCDEDERHTEYVTSENLANGKTGSEQPPDQQRELMIRHRRAKVVVR